MAKQTQMRKMFKRALKNLSPQRGKDKTTKKKKRKKKNKESNFNNNIPKTYLLISL